LNKHFIKHIAGSEVQIFVRLLESGSHLPANHGRKALIVAAAVAELSFRLRLP
jgi:hypothetical protein